MGDVGGWWLLVEALFECITKISGSGTGLVSAINNIGWIRMICTVTISFGGGARSTRQYNFVVTSLRIRRYERLSKPDQTKRAAVY